MILEITFKNLETGKNEKGEVESYDTISTIKSDLKAAGVINDDSKIFKKEDGTVLSETETFSNLGVKNGEVILIEAKPSVSVDEPVKEPTTVANVGSVVNPPVRPIRIGSQKFHQLGIFVMDGSYSMNEEAQGNMAKKDAVDKAIRTVISRFKASRKSRNFSFSVIMFGEYATQNIEVTKVDDIDETKDFDPTVNHNQGTLIYKGLEKAEENIKQFFSGVGPDDLPHSAVVVVLSDGECHDPNQTIAVANRIKSIPKVKICTTFLSKIGKSIPEAEDLMKEVATDSTRDFRKTYDSQTIRDFFENSLSIIV
jgi:hypothetical protein